MEYKVSPEEVIKHIEALGAKASRTTLLNYEKAGITGRPKRGGLGQGRGSFCFYTHEQVANFYGALKAKELIRATMAEIINAKELIALVAQKLDKGDKQPFALSCPSEIFFIATIFLREKIVALQKLGADGPEIEKLKDAYSFLSIEGLKLLEGSSYFERHKPPKD